MSELMLHSLFHIAGALTLGAGLFFILLGSLGLVRLPDFFTRLHAAGMTDTLGAGLVLGGLVFFSGLSLVSLKLMLTAFFLIFTSPIACHAAANAAFITGGVPLPAVKALRSKVDLT